MLRAYPATGRSPIEELFDVLTGSLFMVSQLSSDPGDAPVSVRQSHHLQSIAGERINAPLMAAGRQLIPLLGTQSNSNQWQGPPCL